MHIRIARIAMLIMFIIIPTFIVSLIFWDIQTLLYSLMSLAVCGLIITIGLVIDVFKTKKEDEQ